MSLIGLQATQLDPLSERDALERPNMSLIGLQVRLGWEFGVLISLF
jgi:hypothetical protein